jgi:hypothetical protein
VNGERVPFGQAHSVAHRRRVYRTADALEVDEIGGFEVARRRVFFVDVHLVTLHRARRGATVWVLASLATVALLAGLLSGPAKPVAYVLYGVTALTAIGALVSAAPVWVVTAHGRRTRALLRFRLREARAQLAYREICDLASAAQAALAARRAEVEGKAADQDEIPAPPTVEAAPGAGGAGDPYSSFPTQPPT